MLPVEQYGGSRAESFGANATLYWERAARLVAYTATTTGLTVTLATAVNVDIPYGVLVRIIANDGANSFDVDDSDGVLGSPITLLTNQALIVGKIDNAGAAEFRFTRWAVL